MDAIGMLPQIAGARVPIDAGAVLPPGASMLENLAAHDQRALGDWLGTLHGEQLRHLYAGSWDMAARAAQRPPEGDWRTWLILAGRGFGKTRAGAEWVMAQVRGGLPIRIALVAGTLHEARSVMVDGESGLMAIAHGRWTPKWEGSTRRLLWAETGAQAQIFSAAEPESLRGPQHHVAWLDEIAKWRDGEAAWANLQMGLRLGADPRVVATTSPRAVPLVRRLVAEEGESVRITRGRTRDNAAHLAPKFIRDIEGAYGGTSFGRQELYGELIDEIEGALWNRALLDRQRVTAAPERVRTVIGVDPPAGAGDGADACGIVVVGLGADGHAYVLADCTVQGGGPERWARAVADAAAVWDADRVIAEVNQGGAMVEQVLRAADADLPVRGVHATSAKATRAEPVAVFYEAGRIFHAGLFPALEDQLCGMMAAGGYEGPGRSPDRADALVWAVHELLLGKRRPRPGVRGL